MSRLLQLIWLASPASHVGGFSYSEGLEAAIDRSGVTTETLAADWLSDQLHLTLARSDLAVIARAIPAWRNDESDRIRQLNDWVMHTRETSELREHESANPAHIAACAGLPPTYPVAFALAASQTEAGTGDCLLAYALGWAENLVQAALKSVLLGQSAGQRILARLAREVPPVMQHAMALADDERQAFSPTLAILSAQHETQYPRLFRS